MESIATRPLARPTPLRLILVLALALAILALVVAVGLIAGHPVSIAGLDVSPFRWA